METLPAAAKPRVYFDVNAGAWCFELPGRLPVQAESWQAALDAITPPATETELRLQLADQLAGQAVAAPRRRWWQL